MYSTVRIIGVSGKIRSGKDLLASLLIDEGWFGASFGDIIRGFARKRHADKPDPISVANMTETANALRATHGPDFVLKEALRQYEEASATKQYEGMVLYSIRAPVEVDWILTHGGDLIWVHADDDIRYARDRMSRRDGEADIDFEEFKRQEALHWNPVPDVPIEAQMNLVYVRSKATRIIENNGSDREAFKKEADKLLKLLRDE